MIINRIYSFKYTYKGINYMIFFNKGRLKLDRISNSASEETITKTIKNISNKYAKCTVVCLSNRDRVVVDINIRGDISLNENETYRDNPEFYSLTKTMLEESKLSEDCDLSLKETILFMTLNELPSRYPIED